MKNVVPETTGYEYFKKQNDRALKKNSLNDNKVHVLILLNILVPKLPPATLWKRNFMVSVKSPK